MNEGDLEICKQVIQRFDQREINHASVYEVIVELRGALETAGALDAGAKAIAFVIAETVMNRR